MKFTAKENLEVSFRVAICAQFFRLTNFEETKFQLIYQIFALIYYFVNYVLKDLI